MAEMCPIMATPCILITSCSDFFAEKLVEDILDVEIVSAGKAVVESIVSHDWKIDTKYYTADVRLCVTKERTIGDAEFAESVEAFIVYFNPEEKESFEAVMLWKAYLNEIDPEVKMLVCDRCLENSAIGLLEAQTWCIENGFELVELNAEMESDSDIEDDFVETTGIKRIIQSLHAHTWSNLHLKDSRHAVSPLMHQLMKEEYDTKQVNCACEVNDTKKSTLNNSEQDQHTESTDSIVNTTDRLRTETGSRNKSENQSVGRLCTETDSRNKTEDQSVGKLCTENDSTNNAQNQSVVSEKSHNLTEEREESACDNCDKRTDVAPEGHQAACGDNGEGKKSRKGKSKKKVKQASKEERLDSLLPAEDVALFEALGNEDPGGESFEKLFERFAHMKDKANNLPQQERKKYAENVAIAFWKAIGGDEDEIGDLDSDG